MLKRFLNSVCYSVAALFVLFLSGCVNLNSPPFQLGATEEEVIRHLDKPTARYQDGDTVLLEYARGYWGQHTHMGRFDANGKLISWEQVLTVPKFAELKVGKSTKQDVLLKVGQPGEYTRIYLGNYEVWTYHYKEDDVWDSVMHLMFDQKGVLQKMENGLDMMYWSTD